MDIIPLLKTPEAEEQPEYMGVDYSDGSFIEPTDDGGYIDIHPEFVPYKNSVNSSGRYFVYYLHPQHGTNTFYIEHNAYCCWVSAD